ncbi:Pentatricopeptide repeat-containing protein [Melia azedarach]|uniref:Pentatricopeptide repeat-containing protein n=1 Tax=Melia azedarach TaxID=155640 RepID=A0ACC1XQA2_MELAZ|nr:Pentatricopeptide repeat-containing protein [Melia azedarach]
MLTATAPMLVKELIPAKSATSSRAVKQHLFSLIQSCNNVEALAQIHTQIIINGFSQKNHILVKLLSFYITSGDLMHARKVFKKIENPSTTIWNQMIKGHGKSETPEKSVELYKQMVGKETEPDEFTYSFLLTACARWGLFREGEQVHQRVLSTGYSSNVFIRTNLMNLYVMRGGDDGIAHARRVFDDMRERNIVSWNSLLKGYVKCGDIEGALRVFDEMPERNVVSWTTLISGCAQNGKCKKALSLFNEMRRAHVGADQVALVAVLSACSELGDLNLGKCIHSYVVETLCVGTGTISITLNNALIHMYASCGEIEEAYQVFRKMQRRSTVSWTSMITGFAKQGYAQEALVLFEWMESSLEGKEAKPDEISFLGVLCACSHGGFIDEGRQFFQCMNQTYGIKPKIEHYGCMIDLLSRAGFLEEAFSLVQNMPMKPSNAVWGSLLLGCRIYNNAELASQVAQKLVVELDPDQAAAGYLVLLANVYATSKRWLDVAAVRQKLIKMGVKQPPGRSWVQIDGFFHDFLAGDTTHKHASLIYKTIGEITLQSMWEGYPDILVLCSGVEE